MPGSMSAAAPGELAFLAAATGAKVTGCDLAPVLVETARRQAAERGLEIPFEVADVENLPHADAGFDVVTSSVGAIFARITRASPPSLLVSAGPAAAWRCLPGRRTGGSATSSA